MAHDILREYRSASVNTWAWKWKCLAMGLAYFKIGDILPNCSARRSEKAGLAAAAFTAHELASQTVLTNVYSQLTSILSLCIPIMIGITEHLFLC